ncbi:hypothetical protein BSL78_02758 [Apostichopus japonicus]|uniref:NACHT domain-containing protein n=1 Tax=Stichopus japonicus TaxID=307972 RepID=A0A2G8LJ95_STIJA|nr:hypothetical protein BSL78_02758 [Apostichopus japonicus]
MYWFKGGDTSSFPILTLEDGRYGGGEYQQGEYEFTNENTLKIINTQLKHEGNYTVRVYFNEFDFDTTTTELKVYIRPDPPCPLIDACGSTCTGCQLNVTTSGSLSCYVNGSRPMVDVDWIVTNQSGYEYTNTKCGSRHDLVDVLIKQYEKFGFIKPLPWGEPIPIQAFYTTCQCIVTNAKGDVSHHDSDFLSTPEFNNDSANRVIVTADLGYGKTTYTQHLVSDWVSKMTNPNVGKKNQTSEPILIYIHLKEVVPSMILSELVKKMIPVGIDLTVDDIIEIFLNFDLQVLLDGLDELSMSTISTNTSAENPTNDKEERDNLLQDANLTVANLLENTINTSKFKNIKVWVTSREFDDMNASFALPYSKVKLNGFSDPQVNEYIQKTCEYYLNSQAMPQLSLTLDSNMKGSKSQAKSDAKKRETIEEKASNNDSPPVTEGGCNNEKVNNLSIQDDIKSLEARLGKIAFENKLSLSLSKREYWNDKLGKKDTELALAIGLLKYSKKVGSGGSQLEELAFSSYVGIMFYHEFFQEFLAARYVPDQPILIASTVGWPKKDTEWECIEELIKNGTDKATVRLLQFMFGMNHTRLDKAVQTLKAHKMWNDLIDCIYEMSNLEKKQTIIKGLSKGTDINVEHLDRKHHRVALKDFCVACNYSKVKMKRMTFRDECAIDFIKDVTLPSLETLQFLEMNINDSQFTSIITSCKNRTRPKKLQIIRRHATYTEATHQGFLCTARKYRRVIETLRV